MRWGQGASRTSVNQTVLLQDYHGYENVVCRQSKAQSLSDIIRDIVRRGMICLRLGFRDVAERAAGETIAPALEPAMALVLTTGRRQ